MIWFYGTFFQTNIREKKFGYSILIIFLISFVSFLFFLLRNVINFNNFQNLVHYFVSCLFSNSLLHIHRKISLILSLLISATFKNFKLHLFCVNYLLSYLLIIVYFFDSIPFYLLFPEIVVFKISLHIFHCF